ncbi:homocysteine S-methyltransferase family protein [Neomegalonema perideroedes]|uniref:homocysteine S-methyltransferase family protein n=1 Tax=Neomegalonema perideroedes TaxID=217219 RepID=UPI000375FAED|nr:homocysteine S-methyltransferase family protein [Neomegalonema perideroedes]
MSRLAEFLAEGAVLADAAMATAAFSMGLQPGESPDLWAFAHPERAAEIHRAHRAAGARILLTQSFGANRRRLKPFGAEDRCAEVNRAAAARAKVVAQEGAGAGVLVAGCLGPSGVFALSADWEAGFYEQGRALLEGGADLLWAETLGDLAEWRAAASAAARLGAPFCSTLSFEAPGGLTRNGVSPEEFVRAAMSLPEPPAALGVNCGGGPDQVLESLGRLARTAPKAILIAKPSAGLPRLEGAAVVYDWTPEAAGLWAQEARRLGARILGGCCGTEAAHLAAMGAALKIN